ncbi:lysophospholipid acyltransferase family protein [Anaerobacillus sp. MEB173]|uniref:lysophospholipid acyltransferase family protein n=1 Tax=Anaerobacillus sp. MEB173 TaxID=3383345 RepID=UPI003F92482C
MNLYEIGRTIFRGYFNVMSRVEIIGADNVPADGGVILCCNHINNLDPTLLGTFCKRKVLFMAKAELFSIPVLKTVLTKIGTFPVKRGMSDKQALRHAIKVLKEGHVLGIYPEGTRSKTGELGKGLAGVGFFALKTDAAVVPCAIVGDYKPFKKLKMIYGKPLDFSAYREQKISAEEATEYIMSEIKKLIEQHKSEI